MAGNVTIYDVAKRADVSLATVSRVLNNPEKVAEATKQRVLKVIEDLGYRPNMVARGLASRKTTTVGIIISDLTRASVAEMLSGIIDIADNYKYSIKIFSIREDFEAADTVQKIVAEQVDGVLYLNDELSDESIEEVKDILFKNAIPFVFANVSSDDKRVPIVSIDYERASYELTKLLIADERKNIYLLSTARKYSVNTKKESGYLKAMEEANLEPKIFRTSGDVSINTAHFKEYFKDKPIDGAIGVRDSIAVSFLNQAIKASTEVPKKLAIAGFQNTKYASLSRPTLTSLDIPVYDIGAVAMRLLTKLMNKKDVDNIRGILPHYIVKRESTN